MCLGSALGFSWKPKTNFHFPVFPQPGCSVDLVFVLRCRQACPEKAVVAPVDASLTPMIVVTNVGTGAIMLMTAIVLAKEAVAAGKIRLVFS